MIKLNKPNTLLERRRELLEELERIDTNIKEVELMSFFKDPNTLIGLSQKIMKREKISQQELAERLGITRKTLHNSITGKTKINPLLTLSLFFLYHLQHGEVQLTLMVGDYLENESK